jgi:hypothetical protein
MWNTRKAFWNYHQDLSHGRVLFCRKAFGLRPIGELIMSVHPFLPLLTLTLKIVSSLHIVALEN